MFIKIKTDPVKQEQLNRSVENVVPNGFTGEVRVSIFNGRVTAVHKEEEQVIVEHKSALITIWPRQHGSKFQSYDVREHGKIAAAGYFNSELENLDEVIAAIMANHHAPYTADEQRPHTIAARSAETIGMAKLSLKRAIQAGAA
jgi:hypothetical protein